MDDVRAVRHRDDSDPRVQHPSSTNTNDSAGRAAIRQLEGAWRRIFQRPRARSCRPDARTAFVSFWLDSQLRRVSSLRTWYLTLIDSSLHMAQPVEVTTPNATNRAAPNILIATTAMLAFISFWRAAAVVLNDMGSSA